MKTKNTYQGEEEEQGAIGRESRKTSSSSVSSSSSSSSTSSSSSSPWQDGLPLELMDSILRLLPLTDYLHFPSVCSQWRSIHSAHRLRFAPSPPPTLPSFPWLVPLLDEEPGPRPCYNPSEDRIYRLRLSNDHKSQCIASSSHGWVVLLSSSDMTISLFNPISGQHVQLPVVDIPKLMTHRAHIIVSMSAPPTCPDCFLMAVVGPGNILTCRIGDTSWTVVDLNNNGIKVKSVVFYDEKFYCWCSLDHWDYEQKLLVLDPQVQPIRSFRVVELDKRELPLWQDLWSYFLVESERELLLVVEPRDRAFKVFKADLRKMVWLSTKGVGPDRVLFLGYGGGSFSMSAAEVGPTRGNMIYVTPDIMWKGEVWESHDLESENCGNAAARSAPSQATTELLVNEWMISELQWFVPRLDTEI